MATRSYIFYEDLSGNTQYRYHHWDGHIETLGNTLNVYFQNEKDIKNLFSINKDFFSINNTLKEIEKEYVSIESNRFKDYYQGSIIDVINNLVIVSFSENIKDRESTNKEILFNKFEESFNYFYSEKTKKWTVKIGSSKTWIDLPLAIELANKFNEIEKFSYYKNNTKDINNETKHLSTTEAENFWEQKIKINCFYIIEKFHKIKPIKLKNSIIKDFMTTTNENLDFFELYHKQEQILRNYNQLTDTLPVKKTKKKSIKI